MKIILGKILPFFLILFTTFLSAQNLNIVEKAIVRGNCTECEERIEKAAKSADATTADWSPETKVLKVEFNPAKTSLEKILKKIAAVGHDNEQFKADDAVYKKLPGCCLYDRDEIMAELLPNKTKISTEVLKNPNVLVDNHSETTEKSQNIEGITLMKMQDATALNRKNAGLTYNISGKELLKAACCNLSESFETNATVDVSYSNAVTGTKQLKMLGLDQKYTAITQELLPQVRGLSAAYGLNFIPGKWIGSIQLTKGGSTVVNGYESITGQINTELLKYAEKPETAINLFVDSNLRTEMNLTSTQVLSEHWNQSFLIHGNGTFSNEDSNNDGFLDQPKGNQINVAYLLNYSDLDHSGLMSHFGINYVKDERNGGQKGYDFQKPQNTQSLYGVGINTSRFQFWNKTGYVFKDKPGQSIGWMNQVTFHQQNSSFGLRNYDAKETSYYSNLIFEGILGNTNNKFKTGASFMYDSFDENYLTQNYKRNEIAPGIFFEYTLTGVKYTLVAGVRTDFHNLAGTQFTPRVNFKYDISPKTILRLSAGKGFRTANVFAENQQYFASNRTIEIKNNGGNIYGLKPEIAWNYGASLQQEFKFLNRKSSVVLDFFRTDFTHQVLVDLYQSPQKLIFYNLEGSSFANSFQAQWDFSIYKNLDFRLAYKYYDVQANYISGKKEVPFIAKNRGFANVSYATDKTDKGAFWSFDLTYNLVGSQNLPTTASNPQEFQLGQKSEAFSTLNGQIAKNFNDKFRLYLGAENITSYQQDRPILDAKNPFGNYFDAGMVYAPIMPVNFYLGVDFKF
ncbi:TonB-dependent receptor domain-containing protein [Halpernia sp.]|uniref:TonB-dependent receptor domain-containing protein n=1 Tax=Halpernia sp. TaxID=2782209 RepID=UPI003A94FBB0